MNEALLDCLDKAKQAAERAIVDHLVMELRRHGVEVDDRVIEAFHLQFAVSIHLRWR